MLLCWSFLALGVKTKRKHLANEVFNFSQTKIDIAVLWKEHSVIQVVFVTLVLCCICILSQVLSKRRSAIFVGLINNCAYWRWQISLSTLFLSILCVSVFCVSIYFVCIISVFKLTYLSVAVCLSVNQSDGCTIPLLILYILRYTLSYSRNSL